MWFHKGKKKNDDALLDEDTASSAVELECIKKARAILDTDLISRSAIDEYHEALDILKKAEEEHSYDRWFTENSDDIKLLFDRIKTAFLKDGKGKLVLPVRQDKVIVSDEVSLEANAVLRLLRDFGYTPLIVPETCKIYIS